MSTINKSSPTEIIGKVMRSDTVKSAHPLFEPTIVGIDVLNVVDLGDNPNACGQIDRTMGDAHFPSGGTQCLAAVGAEDSIACQYGLERSADVHLVSLLQNEVGGAPETIAANQHRNLFVGQAAFRSLATVPCFLPLNDSRKKVSSASAMPTRLAAFCSLGSARKR